MTNKPFKNEIVTKFDTFKIAQKGLLHQHVVTVYMLKLTCSKSWRTVAYQEVRLRIGPLVKLGCFKSTSEIFLVYFVTISLASGPILSLTSWYATVLYE